MNKGSKKYISLIFILLLSISIISGCKKNKTDSKNNEEITIKKKSSSNSSETKSSSEIEENSDVDIEKILPIIKKLNDFKCATPNYYKSVINELKNNNIILESDLSSEFSKYAYDDNIGVSAVLASIVMSNTISQSEDGENTIYEIDFLVRSAVSKNGEKLSDQAVGANVQSKLKKSEHADLDRHVIYQLIKNSDEKMLKLKLVSGGE